MILISIDIGYTNDERIKLDKTFNVRTTIQGEIFTPINYFSPILIVDSDSVNTDDTYFYIPYLNRYYFRGDTREEGNIKYISLTCDVLMSFKDQIKNCPIIAERSSNIYNAYITDNQRLFKNYSENEVKVLGEFSGQKLWLVGVN